MSMATGCTASAGAQHFERLRSIARGVRAIFMRD
jgi:hypothetical protein